MNRTKRFFMNSFSAAMMQIVVMIVGMITPRVMLSAYGSEINGLVSSIHQFISYFNLVQAGLSGAAIYALYKPIADKDNKAINGIVTAAKKMYMQAGYLFVLLITGLAVVYPFYIKTDLMPPLNVGLLVLVLGVSGVLDFFTLSKYSVLLSADQKNYVISITSIFALLINTTMIVLLAHSRVDILLLRFVVLFTVFFRSAVLLLYCKKNYTFLNFKETPNTKALNKRWDALYQQILGVIQTGTPVVLLTVISRDLKLVSVYAIFNMVIAGLNGVLGIFSSGLAASFGDVIAKGELKILQKAYKEFEFSYYSIITVIYSITFVVIMPFINLYTKGITDTNYNLPVVGFLFVLNALLYCIKSPQGMLVISAGLYKETRWRTTIQATIIVAGGIVLTYYFGLIGVISAMIISNIYRDIDLLFFIPKHVTHTSALKSGIRIARIFLCVLLVYIPVSLFNYTPKDFMRWVLYAGCAGLYSVIIVAGVGYIFERDEMKNIFRRIRRTIGVKK